MHSESLLVLFNKGLHLNTKHLHLLHLLYICLWLHETIFEASELQGVNARVIIFVELSTGVTLLLEAVVAIFVVENNDVNVLDIGDYPFAF